MAHRHTPPLPHRGARRCEGDQKHNPTKHTHRHQAHIGTHTHTHIGGGQSLTFIGDGRPLRLRRDLSVTEQLARLGQQEDAVTVAAISTEGCKQKCAVEAAQGPSDRGETSGDLDEPITSHLNHPLNQELKRGNTHRRARHGHSCPHGITEEATHRQRLLSRPGPPPTLRPAHL